MLDIKILNATLDQLEEERRIPRETILDAIEQSIAAAYKKDYGKKGQIIRSKINPETGDIEFYQVKIAVDDTMAKPALTEAELQEMEETRARGEEWVDGDPDDERFRFDAEKHMYIEDARRIKSDVELGEELVFPLETEGDFGRIAAQTAKQVIIQRIREAEKDSVMGEYAERQGEIVSGIVQKVDRGNVFVDFGRVTGILPRDEQIAGEFYKTGDRIRAFLYLVEETPRGVNLRLSRSHPRFIESLFAMESPEVASGAVEIKSIAREAGSRSKVAVLAHDDTLDPIGALVGQRGVRVTTVMNELGGEKIDIIPWSENPGEYIANALAPARVIDITIDEENHSAAIEVADDQLSLAIGKGGQNVRLAAKLTGWRIDIAGIESDTDKKATPEDAPDSDTGETTDTSDEPTIAVSEDETATDETVEQPLPADNDTTSEEDNDSDDEA